MSTLPPPGPVGFHDLVEGDQLLWTYCRQCHQEVEILARTLSRLRRRYQGSPSG
ncbi:MAG: hypothetical protein MI824_16945 [Hyphomicrobiales bacterium]|nr:hypothetical protein [Hyphomicrobiales bacterium]